MPDDEQTVRLVVTPTGNGSRVWIDGQEIHRLMAVHLQVLPGASQLTLTFAPVNVEVDGEVGRVVREQVRA